MSYFFPIFTHKYAQREKNKLFLLVCQIANCVLIAIKCDFAWHIKTAFCVTNCHDQPLLPVWAINRANFYVARRNYSYYLIRFIISIPLSVITIVKKPFLPLFDFRYDMYKKRERTKRRLFNATHFCFMAVFFLSVCAKKMRIWQK
jgi:hypothetical protein